MLTKVKPEASIVATAGSIFSAPNTITVVAANSPKPPFSESTAAIRISKPPLTVSELIKLVKNSVHVFLSCMVLRVHESKAFETSASALPAASPKSSSMDLYISQF